MGALRLVHSKRSGSWVARQRVYRDRALAVATGIIREWLASDLDDPDQVYPELARRIAVVLARRDAEIARLRAGLAGTEKADSSGAAGSS